MKYEIFWYIVELDIKFYRYETAGIQYSIQVRRRGFMKGVCFTIGALLLILLTACSSVSNTEVRNCDELLGEEQSGANTDATFVEAEKVTDVVFDGHTPKETISKENSKDVESSPPQPQTSEPTQEKNIDPGSSSDGSSNAGSSNTGSPSPPQEPIFILNNPIGGEYYSTMDFYSALQNHGYEWGEVGGPFKNKSHNPKVVQTSSNSFVISWDMIYDDLTPRESILYAVYTVEVPHDMMRSGVNKDLVKKYGKRIQNYSTNRKINVSLPHDSHHGLYVIAKDTDGYEYMFLSQGLVCEKELVDPIPGNNGEIKIEHMVGSSKISWAPVTNYDHDIDTVYYHFRIFDSNNKVCFEIGPSSYRNGMYVNLQFSVPDFTPGEYSVVVTAAVHYRYNYMIASDAKCSYKRTFFTLTGEEEG